MSFVGYCTLHIWCHANTPGEVLRTLLAANAEQLPDAHGVTPLCAAAAAKPWVLNPGKDGATRGTKQYQVIRTGNNLKAVRTLGFAW